MKHYISICCDLNSKEFKRVELVEAFSWLCRPENTKERKEENFLIHPAYCSTMDTYPRIESVLDWFSVVVLDCDNDKSNPDTKIIAGFKESMDGYDYLIYETASSTPECPKFRAIVPLDGELQWSKYAKTAIFHRFKGIADFRATWFFSPNTSKLPTVYDHDVGRMFPARVIDNDIQKMIREDRLKETRNFLLRERFATKAKDPNGWRHLPSVKHCLEGLQVGERDNSLCAACYAMDKNGYREAISTFLDECAVDEQFKRKWRNRYR